MTQHTTTRDCSKIYNRNLDPNLNIKVRIFCCLAVFQTEYSNKSVQLIANKDKQTWACTFL